MNFRYSYRQERPISSVPKWVCSLLMIVVVLQCITHHILPERHRVASDLKAPPTISMLYLYALGDPVALSKYQMLWLQAFDNQSGLSIAFKQLNYNYLIAWLARILELDPLSQYPLLSASRVYGNVNDRERQSQIIRFIRDEFIKDPNRRWKWMAHAVYLAKHRIHDLELAFELATLLTQYAQEAPAWARQMEIYILDDMGETEAAKVLIGGLLENGNITDENELRFLLYRLQLIEERALQN